MALNTLKMQTRSMRNALGEEIKKANEATRQAKIQELTERNKGKAQTRSVLKAILNEAQRRTPVKQPLQTTDISLQDATEKPSQSTAPPNTIQGNIADLSDLGDLVRVDEHDNIKYKALKPYLETLKIDYPAVDDLRTLVKQIYGPNYLIDQISGKQLS